MRKNLDEKVVFGITPNPDAPGTATILIGIPAAAWDYMKDGKTHHFDLTSVGVPIQITLYGAETHDAALKLIEEHNRRQGMPYLDERRRDFSMRTK